jgi:peroxiredoxin
VGKVTVTAAKSASVSVEPGRKVILQVAIPDEAKPWMNRSPDILNVRLQTAADAHINGATTWLRYDASGRVEVNELAPGAYVVEAEPVLDLALPEDSPIRRRFSTGKISFVVHHSKPGDDAPLDLGTLQIQTKGEKTSPPVEAPAPAFIVDEREGGTLSLQELRGRYVLIDFWAAWCKPCEAQLPHLKQVWQEFGQRSDFVLLGLCLGEDPKIIREFVAKHEISWPQGVLSAGFSDNVAEVYNVISLPHIVLIGPDGRIIADNLLDDAIESAVRVTLSPGHP